LFISNVGHKLGLLLRRLVPSKARGLVTFQHGMASLKLLSLLGRAPGSRLVEYPWVLRNMRASGRILDVGCTGSYLHCKLIREGAEMLGVDSRGFERRDPELAFIISDITKMPFRNDCFDAIVAVSTIEHVGLGSYGDPKIPDGDRLAFKETMRVSKPSAPIIVTVPFAEKHRINWQRRYDEFSLGELIGGSHILVEEFFAYVKKGRYAKVPSNRAGDTGIALLKLCKGNDVHAM